MPQGNSSYCWGLVPVNGTNVTVTHEVTSYTGFPSAFAAITVSFGGHSVFPTIEEHMRSRESFHRVFNYAYALIMLLYVPVATAGYYAYGDLTGSPVRTLCICCRASAFGRGAATAQPIREATFIGMCGV